MSFSVFPLEQLLSFAFVVCLGAFVQSATGFAGGLVVIPLMLWFGHGVPEAQSALLTATIPQNLLGVYRFRECIELRKMRWPIALRMIGLPVGVATLYFVEDFPQATVRQLVSGVVLGCVLLIVLFKPRPQETIRWKWTLVAFLSSGYFAGLTGTGGPMMVIWVQSHDWSTERIRSFLFVMYLISIPPILGMLWFAFEQRVLSAVCSATLVLPFVIVVTQLGLWGGSWLGKKRLRHLTLFLLVILGATGLLAPLFR